MTGFASPFWKHVTTVLMGSVAAQITPLLMAPLITRICTPEDMGARAAMIFSWPPISGSISHSSVSCENARIVAQFMASARSCR
jgi:hypothetical protein